jgi:predicted metal-binding membrane protein
LKLPEPSGFAAASRDRTFAVVLAGAIALAWAALFIWERSPYGRYLDHDALGNAGSPYLFVFLVAGWVTMIVAMMLPTSWPLVRLFDRMTSSRPEHIALVSRVIAGYLAVWTLFGIAVHIGDIEVHRLVERSEWLRSHAWIVGAVTLFGAGIYQFSALKYRCLSQCRSPYAFIATHWRGRDARRESFALGVKHGLFCLGCCWSLMLVMFVVGVGSVGWMLVLGAVMAIEKNARWGRRVSAPLGAALIGLAALTVALEGGFLA